MRKHLKTLTAQRPNCTTIGQKFRSLESFTGNSGVSLSVEKSRERRKTLKYFLIKKTHNVEEQSYGKYTTKPPLYTTLNQRASVASM